MEKYINYQKQASFEFFFFFFLHHWYAFEIAIETNIEIAHLQLQIY